MKENRYSLSIISKKHYLCNMFHLEVNKFIEEKSLFFQKDKILVALSGGADSVALLRVLLALGYTCEAAIAIFTCAARSQTETKTLYEAYVMN